MNEKAAAAKKAGVVGSEEFWRLLAAVMVVTIA